MDDQKLPYTIELLCGVIIGLPMRSALGAAA